MPGDETHEKPKDLSDAELDRVCAENLYLIQADDLRLAREIEAASHQVISVFEQVKRRPTGEGAPSEAVWRHCRRVLPDYVLLAGEIVRLWQPLAPLPEAGRPEGAPASAALEACHEAWRRLRRAGELLVEHKPDEAERVLAHFVGTLGELQRAAYQVTPDSYIGDLVLGHAGAWQVFDRMGLACRECVVAPRHTLRDAAACHPFDLEELRGELLALVDEAASPHSGTSSG